MAEMNLAARLLTMVAGGTAAAYVDQTYPQATQSLGSVKITPGAMGAIGLSALALMFPKLPARELVGNLGGGALVYEGVKLGQTNLIPLLTSGAQTQTLTTVTPGTGQVAAGYMPAGYMYGPSMTDWEIQRQLMAVRAAA